MKKVMYVLTILLMIGRIFAINVFATTSEFNNNIVIVKTVNAVNDENVDEEKTEGESNEKNEENDTNTIKIISPDDSNLVTDLDVKKDNENKVTNNNSTSNNIVIANEAKNEVVNNSVETEDSIEKQPEIKVEDNTTKKENEALTNDIEKVTKNTVTNEEKSLEENTYNENEDTNFTGIKTDSSGISWYYKDGKINNSYTGTYFEGNVANIIENGKVYGIVDKTTSKIMLINNIYRMIIDGKVDYNYNGIGKNENGTWYVRNGLIDFKFTGVYGDKNGDYWLIKKNKVETERNSVELINGRWLYIEKGKTNFNYDGIAFNDAGTWVVQKGIITFKYSGTYTDSNGSVWLVKNSKVETGKTSVENVNGEWTYIERGKANYTFTGIASNAYGSWYIEKGKVNFNFTGTHFIGNTAYIVEKGKIQAKLNKDGSQLVRINNNYRMVIDGKVDYNYTGIAKNENGTWLVKDGTIDFKYTGTYVDANKDLWILTNSKVQTGTTGLIFINRAWIYVEKGKTNYNFTGIAKNQYGSWYVEKGNINFKFTGTYYLDDLAYVIENGKVCSSFEKNAKKMILINGVWRMTIEGKVDYSYTGIGTNANGTWYLENGAVKFKHTGNYTDANKDIWLIRNGKVETNRTELLQINGKYLYFEKGKTNYNYTGIAKNSLGTWYVEKGSVNFQFTGSHISGNNAYIIENGRVYKTINKNENQMVLVNGVWRMAIGGKVDYKYTGVGTNSNGTWYIVNGAVKFDYTGSYFPGNNYSYLVESGKVLLRIEKNFTGIKQVGNAFRYIVQGKVNYNYDGVVTNDSGEWIFVNGKIDMNLNGEHKTADGSVYNVVNGKVKDVICLAGHTATMWVEKPFDGNKYITGNLEICGWALSDEYGDIISIYLDGKYVDTISRYYREDVFTSFNKGEYGGSVKNPDPGFRYNLNTEGLSKGNHTLKIVNYAKDEHTIIQSRVINFTITNLTKSFGIDVSKYQGDINWALVKQSGVEFAILRIGYYLQSSNTPIKDPYFEQYYSECKRLGIAVGGYFYSYAYNGAEGAQEAQICLSMIQGKHFELPIFLDVEDNILKNAVNSGITNVNELTNASIAFCDIMNNSGHRGGVYASRNFFYQYLNTPVLERYNIWLAHYTTMTDYSGKFDLWQFTNSGSINGIAGPVDLDWCFSRYY